MERDKIVEFLYHLRNSHHSIRDIYMSGSCFQLFLMFKSLFPAAEAWYSLLDGHYIIQYSFGFWDIGGEISLEYVKDKKYELVTDKIQLESSKLHKYGDKFGVSYKKYLKTI